MNKIIKFFIIGCLLCGAPGLYALESSIGTRWALPYSKAKVLAVDISADSKYVATANADKTIKIWQAADGKLVKTLRGHNQTLVALKFSPDQKFIYSAAFMKEGVFMFDLKTGRLIKKIAVADSFDSFDISPDGSKMVVSASLANDNNTFRVGLFDIETGKLIKNLYTEKTTNYVPSTVTFSPDGKYIACGVQNKMKGIQLFNVETQKLVYYKKHSEDIVSLDISPDGKTIAAGDFTGHLLRYDLKTGRLIGKSKGPQKFITSVSFHPSGNYVVTTQYGRSARFYIWDVKTGNVVFKHPEGYNTQQVVVAPNGKFLALERVTFGNLGDPTTAEVYDLGTKEELKNKPANFDMSTFSKGQKIKAFYKGGWYTGVINKKGAHSYLIKFDNARPSYWGWVKPQDLREP